MNSAAVTSHASPATGPIKLGALILAAGSSSRLGEPKQLLHYEGQPLVCRAAQAALSSHASPVVVVLGAHAEKIRPAVAGLPVIVVEAAAWAEGMGSSLSAGLSALEAAAPALDAVVIALCDQPHFTSSHVTRLSDALRENKTIAATRHSDGAGVPAIFLRAHFPALRALTGAQGARRVIAAHAGTTAALEFPELAWDIDTPADRERLNSR